MTTEPSAPTLVFIDSCAVNRFAELNLDPVRALARSEFVVAVIPDLAGEYRRGLAARFVEPHIKALLQTLLEKGRPVPAPETAGLASRGTDADLVALTRTAIVITLDTKPPWTGARDNPGLLPWRTVETGIRQGESLVAILRTASSRLGKVAAGDDRPQ